MSRILPPSELRFRRPRSFAHSIAASRGALGVAGLALLAALLALALYRAGGPAALHDRYGWPATLLLVATQSIVAFWPVPIGEAIAFGNSMVHGFWIGTTLGWLGWMTTAALQYGVARRVATDFDFATAIARLPAWVQRFPVEHPLFLIFGRIVPGPGPQLVNCAAGAFRVPLWRHLWCSAIGVLPGAMIISGAATGLDLL